MTNDYFNSLIFINLYFFHLLYIIFNLFLNLIKMERHDNVTPIIINSKAPREAMRLDSSNFK